MNLSDDQIKTLSSYLADVSKILIGSVVVGFFIPTSTGVITIPVFLIGSMVAMVTLWISVILIR